MSDDTINGGTGNDTIFAGIGNDLISGGLGDDVIFDGVGNDTVSGDEGDDSFWLASGSNDGNDSLDGGADFDTLIEDLSAETAQSISTYTNLSTGTHYIKETPGVGVDTLVGVEGYRLIGDFDAEVIGSNVGNLIITDLGADSISGLAGADTIQSGGGNDTVIGGSGADQLETGDGDDLIFVDNVNDVVLGGAGEDRVNLNTTTSFVWDLSAWSGIERVDGNSGNDTIDASSFFETVKILGNAGNDSLTGGNGEDSLEGGAGNDTLVGGAKRDFLFGDAGADRMEGGLGNDYFYVDNSGDVAIGGDGTDRVTITNASGVSIDMSTWSGIERIDGAGGNDSVDGSSQTTTLRLQGNDGDDTLEGGSANDQFFGDAGTDSLIGNGGADVLVGGAGQDVMEGGEGDDVFFISEDGDLAIGGDGLDRARLDNGVSSINLYMGDWSGIERFTASEGNDTLTALGTPNGMSINASGGDDFVEGGLSDDLIFGGDGDDTLSGTGGNDFIWGGAGSDVYYGGTGDDWFYLADTTDRVGNGGDGEDRVVIIQASLSLTIDATWIAIERVDGAAGAEVVDASDYGAALFMWANAGADQFTGTAFADSIFGNDGNDTLDGGSGGDDVLLGGNGLDNFIFADGAGTDRINDWQDGLDLMDLSGITGVSGFGDLGITTGPVSTTISAGAETIILTGYTGPLDSSDFDFGA